MVSARHWHHAETIQRSYEYRRTQQHICANAEGWQWMKDACDRAEASKKVPYPRNLPLCQTTFVWHVTVNSKKLSATMATDHTTLTHCDWQDIQVTCIRYSDFYSIQQSLVFDTATFLRLCQHSND